ncbi:uncharacterized protein TNCV_1916291 [Trichonephila clavipes]|uniref:DUF5641 domain-containing protein n=1 Tax=Trichonephila clavipes TaxID=2585209 RepID=A0A8X7BCQ8_TRICX|nr:uncharacterized protein TNCV_1916291 [Trichonephila clavipes]
MPISNDSYEEAWQKLLDRYDNKKQIVQSLIKTFLEQKSISEANCSNLRKLLDTSDECLIGLNALESRRLWAIKSSEEEFPNMKAFLDFLNVRCSSLELMLNKESECKIPIRSEVITSSPEHTNDYKLSLRSRWDIVQKMKLGFWRKWKIDYLSNLQNRTKWKSPNNNFKVGEIVIIKEDNIPPATWPLGILIEKHIQVRMVCVTLASDRVIGVNPSDSSSSLSVLLWSKATILASDRAPHTAMSVSTNT